MIFTVVAADVGVAVAGAIVVVAIRVVRSGPRPVPVVVAISVGVDIAARNIHVAVVNDRPAVPTAAPTVPAPATATATHGSADSHADTERDKTSGNDGAGAISRRIVRRTVYDGRIIRWHVDDLRTRRLDHDDLLPALSFGGHGLLRRGLQVSGSLGLLTQPLHRGHHVRLLVVKGAAQR